METIFVSLTSLPDKELLPTLKNIYSAAQNPERIYVGLIMHGASRSLKKELTTFVKNNNEKIKVVFTKIPKGSIDKKLSVLGLGKNRNAALELYDDQDYVLQIDAHSLLADSWDSKLIDMYADAKAEVPDKIPILTAYATPYKYVDGKREFYGDGFNYCYYFEDKMFYDCIPSWRDQNLPFHEGKKFLPSIKFCANFAFSTGEFAKSNSLPKEVIFFEEEVIQSVELLDKGFALVFPIVDSPIVGHLYGHDATKENSRTAISDLFPNGDPINRPDIANNIRLFYLSYLAKNQDKVKKYEEYAKINLKAGTFRKKMIFLEEY